MRIGVLKDVACVPNVETGASVPSYSGGLDYFQNQSEENKRSRETLSAWKTLSPEIHQGRTGRGWYENSGHGAEF